MDARYRIGFGTGTEHLGEEVVKCGLLVLDRQPVAKCEVSWSYVDPVDSWSLDDLLEVLYCARGFDLYEAYDLGVYFVSVFAEGHLRAKWPKTSVTERRVARRRDSLLSVGSIVNHGKDEAFGTCVQEPLGHPVILVWDSY